MKDFVADEQVQEKFLSVAQGRPGFSGQLCQDQCKSITRYHDYVIASEFSMEIDHPLDRDPIVLFSDNVQDYTVIFDFTEDNEPLWYICKLRSMKPNISYDHIINNREKSILPGHREQHTRLVC